MGTQEFLGPKCLEKGSELPQIATVAMVTVRAHLSPGGTLQAVCRYYPGNRMERAMGRGLLLWLIGIPLPIILIVWLLGGLS